MNRYVLVYMSMIDHLRKGLLSPNELVVLVSLVLAAGWSEGRADYARVERNVHRLHRELFFDQETGNQVWTRQGLDKIVKSLVAKGYVVDEGKWWYLPSYRKWQMEVPKAFKTQRTSAKEAQEKATPVAKSLVEGTQEKATPVAIEGPEEQPPLLPGATPVAKKATPVAKKATPVAPDRAEIGVTSESPAPSYMTHTSNNHTTPLPPQGEEAGAAEEEEKLLSELEEYFTQQLEVPHLGRSDFRHLRSFVKRGIPVSLIREAVADVKRSYKPKYPGDRIQYVGLFVREIETRFAAPTPAAPAQAPGSPAATPGKSRSHAYETARLSYYAQRVATEFPNFSGAKGIENKRLREGFHDADFHRLIRSEAAELARKLAGCPPMQRRYYELQHPLAALAAELDEHERGVS